MSLTSIAMRQPNVPIPMTNGDVKNIILNLSKFLVIKAHDHC